MNSMIYLIILSTCCSIASGIFGWLYFATRKKLLSSLAEVRQRNRELRNAESRNENLETELGAAKTEISGLTGQLEIANAEIESLRTQLETANAEIESLTGQLEIANAEIEGLRTRLGTANAEIESLTGQLEIANAEIEGLRTRLGTANAEIESLTGQLEIANAEIESLRTQLETANAEIESLTGQLEIANAEITNLTQQLEAAEQAKANLSRQLEQVSEKNENALWLLYLSELSLQASAVVLHSERKRSSRLIQNYRDLEKRYQTLHGGYTKAVESYDDFCDEVETKARRRLVRRGIGVALSFIPGFGLIDILSDLGEIVEFVKDAGEDISEFSDTVESSKLSGNAIQNLEDFAPITSTEIKGSPSNENVGETSIALTDAAQRTMKKTFERNLTSDNRVPRSSDLNAFVKEAIQRTKGWVEAMPGNESRKEAAITKLADNFKQFGIEYCIHHKARRAPGNRKSTSSKN